jgi:rubrerythrin
MELKGSKTEANLLAAFESKAHQKNMYDSFAYRFAYVGLQQVQDAIYNAAKLEATHAKILYEFLYGPVKDTKENMKLLLEDQRQIGAAYYECAKIAKEEGFEEAAAYFADTAKIHDEHRDMLEQFVYIFENDKVYKKDEDVDWVCVACGHVARGRNAPEECPYCKHPVSLFHFRYRDF